MTTNTKAVKNAIRLHILEAVTDYNGEVFLTVDEAVHHLKSEFERVANYPVNMRNIPNDKERFHDYLNGLPFAFEHNYHSIVEFLNGLGINPQGKKFDFEKSANLYSYLIFKEIA